jgi:hypothetical protein
LTSRFTASSSVRQRRKSGSANVTLQSKSYNCSLARARESVHGVPYNKPPLSQWRNAKSDPHGLEAGIIRKPRTSAVNGRFPTGDAPQLDPWLHVTTINLFLRPSSTDSGTPIVTTPVARSLPPAYAVSSIASTASRRLLGRLPGLRNCDLWRCEWRSSLTYLPRQKVSIDMPIQSS